MADTRHAIKTPICCGENLYVRCGCRELLEKRAADIIMPDPESGRVIGSKESSKSSQTYYIPFAPHCVVSPIGTMASSHVCASIPNFLVCEWHPINNRQLWKEFVKEGEIIKEGHITLTERQGSE
jgi:galactonate dehydratase